MQNHTLVKNDKNIKFHKFKMADSCHLENHFIVLFKRKKSFHFGSN